MMLVMVMMAMVLLHVPVIGGACLLVDALGVYLGDFGVYLHHVQRTMAQQPLQGEQIAAGAQIGDGERVPEPVRVGVLDAGFGAQGADQLPQGISSQRRSKPAQEQGRVWIPAVLPAGQVAPEGAAGGFTQVHKPALASFGVAFDAVAHRHLAGFGVHVANGQPGQLGCPQPGIQQDHDDGPVPQSGGALHGEFEPAVRLGFLAGVAGFDHGLDFLPRKRLHRLVGEFGRRHRFHRAGDIEFLGRPTEEGAKCYPGIAHCFGREFNIVMAGNSPGGIFGQQESDIRANLLGRYCANI